MENIKESLILAMLENQCRILAKLRTMERRFETDLIKQHEGSTLVLEQFKKIEELEEIEYKKLYSETIERASKISDELKRNEKTIQE